MIGTKGSAFTWLVILIAMFAVGIVYVMFDRVFTGALTPGLTQYLDTVTYPNGTAVNVTDAKNTVKLLETVWRYWPLLAWGGLIMTGFVAAQRREPNEYNY